MSGKEFFEKLQPGMQLNLGSHIFGAEEIIRFAQKYDPQPFHLSEEGASNSNFGHLCASGWHTVAVWMRHNVVNGPAEYQRLTGFGDPISVLGPSPGVRNIKWLRPVFVDDTIRFSTTIESKRLSDKRPGWGLVFSKSEGINQDGKPVISFNGAINIRLD